MSAVYFLFFFMAGAVIFTIFFTIKVFRDLKRDNTAYNEARTRFEDWKREHEKHDILE